MCVNVVLLTPSSTGLPKAFLPLPTAFRTSWNDIEPLWEDLGRLLWQTSRTSRNDIEPQWGRGRKAFGRPDGSSAAIPLYALVSFAIFHRSATSLPRSSHRFAEAFHRGLPGIFRTSARNLPEVCQEPSGRLPGTFRTSARQASGRPRNDGDLPEVCQHPSLVFPTVFLTRCLPWEGGSARAWQKSGGFLADPPEGTFRWQRGLLIPGGLLIPFRG